MIERLAEVRILDSFPCIAAICVIVLLLIFSRFYDHLSVILKLFALIIFAFQVVWQIIDGFSFQEMLLIWSAEILIYLFTTKDPDREIPQKFKLKEDEEQDNQDTKEDNQ